MNEKLDGFMNEKKLWLNSNMIKKLRVVLRSSRPGQLSIAAIGHGRIPHAGERQKVPPSGGVGD